MIRNLAVSFGVTKQNIANWNNQEIAQFEAFKTRNTQCLKNLPQKTFQSPTCGNGFVEDDEECDCGLLMECNNLQCHPKTCKLLPKTSCVSGKLRKL